MAMVHKSIKLNEESKKALADWLLSDDIVQITLGDVKVEGDKVTAPIEFRFPSVEVKGRLVFENQDIAAEILGHYANECGDDELFEFAMSLTKDEASINYLKGLREEE